ncbi:MAG: hypothetical protein CUN55_09095 [Phototrophicales bacterium]|nr:MAG: hypothetical protein CUN55_09095 [Phototrophicales bacterium]
MHYVVIGHPCQDIIPTGYAWGGGVIYSGLTAYQLGATVSVITRCQLHPDLDPRLHWHIIPDTTTTIFENRYDPLSGERQQFMHARAGDIDISELSKRKISADIVHLAPVANEIRYEAIPSLDEKTWLVATPQGWMRQLGDNHRVIHQTWQGAERLLPYLKALSLSEEDVQGDLELVRYYASVVPFVLYTKGYKGAVLFMGNETLSIDAFPASVVDLTGAGDVIAAAFFIRLYETHNPQEALEFGAAAAAIAIEGRGASNIPTREQIAQRRRLQQH